MKVLKGSVLAACAVLVLSACGGGGGSSGTGTGTGSNTSTNSSSAALYNAPLTNVGATGNYILTTQRTVVNITQNGITRQNVILPTSQAAFCSDDAVHQAVNQTIGFMGALQITSCTFSGTAGQIDMMIDLGNGQGYSTAGRVSFSYALQATVTGTSTNPGITGFTPASAAAGALVVITGTNFAQSASSYSVSFNGVTATPTVRTLTQLGVFVPNGATTGPVTVTDLTSNQTYLVTSSFTVMTNVGSSVTGPGPMAGTWTYTSPGGVAWSSVVDATVPNAGTVYESSMIADSQQTSAETSVTLAAAGNVSFYYKVESEANYDFLKFYVDGVLTGTWSGAVPWTLATYPLTAGTHILKWTYVKDYALSTGLDAAWLSQVTAN